MYSKYFSFPRKTPNPTGYAFTSPVAPMAQAGVVTVLASHCYRIRKVGGSKKRFFYAQKTLFGNPAESNCSVLSRPFFCRSWSCARRLNHRSQQEQKYHVQRKRKPKQGSHSASNTSRRNGTGDERDWGPKDKRDIKVPWVPRSGEIPKFAFFTFHKVYWYWHWACALFCVCPFFSRIEVWD